MSPSADDVAWARRVLADAEDGVHVVDGVMVDAPVLARARRILAQTRQCD
jgi:citrate lyase subunit beta/citryl-CoA lyase